MALGKKGGCKMDVLLLSHLFLAQDYFHTYISSYLLSSAPWTHPLQFLPRLAHMGLGAKWRYLVSCVKYDFSTGKAPIAHRMAGN